jgi:hypothetical protein
MKISKPFALSVRRSRKQSQCGNESIAQQSERNRLAANLIAELDETEVSICQDPALVDDSWLIKRLDAEINWHRHRGLPQGDDHAVPKHKNGFDVHKDKVERKTAKINALREAITGLAEYKALQESVPHVEDDGLEIDDLEDADY